MKENENDIEDLFKDSFQDFEAEVSPSVWSNVQTALKGAGLGLLFKTMLNKIGTNTLVAIVSSAAAVVGTVVFMNWGGAKPHPENAGKITDPNKQTVEMKAPEVALTEAKEKDKQFIKDLSNSEKAAANSMIETAGNKEKINQASEIKKDKINEVINEYANQSVASIAVSPIGGTVPLIINLANNGTGKINKWDFGDGQKETGTNPVHVYDTPGVYTVTLTSTGTDGKTVVDNIKVEVTGNSSIPETPSDFSPNGDGYKDNFTFSPVNMTSMNVVIFDKEKNIVFRSEKLDAKWDGKDLKGKPAKEGIYFYILTAVGVDGKKYEKKEKINLTR